MHSLWRYPPGKLSPYLLKNRHHEDSLERHNFQDFFRFRGGLLIFQLPVWIHWKIFSAPAAVWFFEGGLLKGKDLFRESLWFANRKSLRIKTQTLQKLKHNQKWIFPVNYSMSSPDFRREAGETKDIEFILSHCSPYCRRKAPKTSMLLSHSCFIFQKSFTPFFIT